MRTLVEEGSSSGPDEKARSEEARTRRYGPIGSIGERICDAAKH